MIPSSQLSEAGLVDSLLSSFPEIDVWSYNEKIIAVHIGLPTKTKPRYQGGWKSIKAAIEVIP